jgi:predicted Zn-dependent protease
MNLLKKIKLSITLCLCITLPNLKAETQIPNLEANLDEQSLSNPSYIIGQHWFRRLNGSQQLIVFPPAYDYLRNALSTLLPHTGLYQKNIEIGLLNSSKSNAFVLPGNHLYLYSGMLSKIKNEQTLFALLAHELAHLDLRHYERQNQHNKQEQSKAMLLMGAGIAAALAGAQGDATYALFLSGIANKEENRLSYSRIQEQEADRQARKYLISAGLNENATTDLFLTFFQTTIGQEPIEFLSTHPIPETRLADSISTQPLKSILKQGNQSQFQQFRATMMAYRASLLLDSDSYLDSQLSLNSQQNYAKALVAFLNNDTKTSLLLSKTLNENLENQAYLKAKILMNNNESQRANKIIHHQLNLNKDQLAFIELSDQKNKLDKTLIQHNKLLQYQIDIINRIELEQAKDIKNLALTRAYEAKIAFSKGKSKIALELLKRAEPLAEGKDLEIIERIKKDIAETIDIEKGNDIKQS